MEALPIAHSAPSLLYLLYFQNFISFLIEAKFPHLALAFLSWISIQVYVLLTEQQHLQ